MIARLTAAWTQRAPLERWLLASLFLLFLPVALVFLVALPLIEDRAAARAAQEDALALYLWVQARDAEWQARGTGVEMVPASDEAQSAAGTAEVAAALERTGLSQTIRTLENTGDRQISLRLEGARFADVTRFLEGVRPILGYRIARLRLAAEPTPGLIAVELELQP